MPEVEIKYEIPKSKEEVRARIAAAQDELQTQLDFVSSNKMDFSRDGMAEAAEKLRSLNPELNDLREEMDRYVAVDNALLDAKKREHEALVQQGRAHADYAPTEVQLVPKAEPGIRSLSATYLESDQYRNYQPGIGSGLHKREDLNLRALFQTTAGYAPESVRTGDIVPVAVRPTPVLARIPQMPTTSPSVVYMEQTTLTAPSSMGISEGAVYTEAAIAYTERTSPVVKRGVFLPVTDEQMADVPGIRMLIDNDLVGMMMRDVENQIFNGNGTAPNLSGILNNSNINTVAKDSDQATFSALLEGIKSCRVTGRATPDLIVLNLTDWFEMAATQLATGQYMTGSMHEGIFERLWGLNIVMSDALAEGTGLVGAFSEHCYIRDRQDIDIKTGPRLAVNAAGSGTEYTIPTGQMNIFGDIRLTFVVRRGAAFTQVTGL